MGCNFRNFVSLTYTGIEIYTNQCFNKQDLQKCYRGLGGGEVSDMRIDFNETQVKTVCRSGVS